MESIQLHTRNGRFYKPELIVFDMVSSVKCEFCGNYFIDNHPGRKRKKFCCREHFREYKKIHGCGNKGKTWEETYSPETLEFMKDRISKKGKEHFNYNSKRPDNTLRSFLNNPNKTEELKEKLKKLLIENPEEVIDFLVNNINQNKTYLYQRKAYENYGKKCSMCGQTEGQIDVHHKDKNRKNNKMDNLQVLCASCHGKLHKQ